MLAPLAHRLLLLAALAGCRSAPEDAPAPAAEPRPAPEVDVERALEPALAHLAADRLDECLRELDALLAAAPAPAVALEAQRWRGHVLTQLGDPEGALEAYRAALALGPGDAWLHYACGIAASTMGEHEVALASFTRAIELDPGHFKALQWRGETHLLLGDARAALDDLTRAVAAIEAAPDEALAYAGTDRPGAMRMTLALRIEAAEALGDHAAAERDRERRAALD